MSYDPKICPACGYKYDPFYDKQCPTCGKPVLDILQEEYLETTEPGELSKETLLAAKEVIREKDGEIDKLRMILEDLCENVCGEVLYDGCEKCPWYIYKDVKGLLKKK